LALTSRSSGAQRLVSCHRQLRVARVENTKARRTSSRLTVSLRAQERGDARGAGMTDRSYIPPRSSRARASEAELDLGVRARMPGASSRRLQHLRPRVRGKRRSRRRPRHGEVCVHSDDPSEDDVSRPNATFTNDPLPRSSSTSSIPRDVVLRAASRATRPFFRAHYRPATRWWGPVRVTRDVPANAVVVAIGPRRRYARPTRSSLGRRRARTRAHDRLHGRSG